MLRSPAWLLSWPSRQRSRGHAVVVSVLLHPRLDGEKLLVGPIGSVIRYMFCWKKDREEVYIHKRGLLRRLTDAHFVGAEIT